MTQANPGWALLAVQYGHADQAHPAREFRGLKGLTPSSLARAGTDADFLQDAPACPLGVSKPPAANYMAANGSGTQQDQPKQSVHAFRGTRR